MNIPKDANVDVKVIFSNFSNFSDNQRIEFYSNYGRLILTLSNTKNLLKLKKLDLGHLNELYENFQKIEQLSGLLSGYLDELNVSDGKSYLGSNPSTFSFRSKISKKFQERLSEERLGEMSLDIEEIYMDIETILNTEIKKEKNQQKNTDRIWEIIFNLKIHTVPHIKDSCKNFKELLVDS